MKLTDTLRFFAIVVALLALLCIVFPSEGIEVAGTTLRFPKLHSVLAPEQTKSINELLVPEKQRDLSGLRDSLIDCRQHLFASQTRFWLPNDDITLFDRFFASVEQAQAKQRLVRVVHYGDSQIEQDRISCRLRERLQSVFGGGGPGMLPLRQMVPTVSFNQYASGNITGLSTWGDNTFERSNGNYGPMLRCWHLNGGCTMSLYASKGNYAAERAGHFSSIRVLFNNRPGPLRITMTDRKHKTTFSDANNQPCIGMIAWRLDSATTSAQLIMEGNADIYGVLVDDGFGVAVDNIGMRGVSGHQFKHVNLQQLTTSYALLDVGLIIMQFGGNSVPYLKSDKSIEQYCQRLGEQIDYVHQACPEAVILFVGPSDMSTKVGGHLATYPKLPTVVTQLREMANQHGAAYWSIYDAMGGENSMIAWNKNGLAGSDYIHFSFKGANLMGDYLSDALLKLYELYLIRKQLSNEEFNRLWKSVQPLPQTSDTPRNTNT